MKALALLIATLSSLVGVDISAQKGTISTIKMENATLLKPLKNPASFNGAP
jgi:hypothetical protein